MMNTNHEEQTLNIAVQSLVGNEPDTMASDRAQQRLMDRLSNASDQTASSRTIRGLATAAALAVLVLPLVLLMPSPGKGLAFADVQRYFSSYSTLRVEFVTRVAGQVTFELTAVVDESGRARVDVPAQFTMIEDHSTRNAIQLDHRAREARVIDLGPDEWTEPGALEVLEQIREFEGQAELLEHRTAVRGHEAIGFELIAGGQPMRLFVTESGMPLQLLIGRGGFAGNEAADSLMETVIDFYFDEPIDPGVFAVDIPSDYQRVEAE
jgi:hypothetical protein